MKLVDINVWIALINGNHVHHPLAAQFWQHETQPLAFCRVTQLGFLRLTTNKLVMNDTPFTPKQAWAAYEELQNNPRIVFCEESATLDAQFKRFTQHAKLSPGDWTDAYLASVAITSGCTLVSLDAGFKRFSGLRFEYLANA
jgi:toxin-antitoxin system PIN domain toxin